MKTLEQHAESAAVALARALKETDTGTDGVIVIFLSDTGVHVGLCIQKDAYNDPGGFSEAVADACRDHAVKSGDVEAPVLS